MYSFERHLMGFVGFLLTARSLPSTGTSSFVVSFDCENSEKAVSLEIGLRL